MPGTYMVLPPIGSPFWADPVATSSALPTTDRVGTVRQTLDSGAFYSWNGSSWSSVGNGDVTGPGSATDNAVARFDGTGGKTLQNSVVIVSDTGAVSGVTDLTVAGAVAGVTSLSMSAGISGATTISASGNVTLTGSTASRALTTNGSKVITASATTDTELGYVSGVTSAIQTQIDTKVAGPGSATDNAVTRFDATTGKLVQNSGVIVDDSNNVSGVANFNSSAIRVGSVGSPTTSAALDVNTTTGALLLPRMTTTQRDNLTATAGMLVYNTTTDRMEGYIAGAWRDITGWGA